MFSLIQKREDEWDTQLHNMILNLAFKIITEQPLNKGALTFQAAQLFFLWGFRNVRMSI